MEDICVLRKLKMIRILDKVAMKMTQWIPV
jgi:hypothetical protein